VISSSFKVKETQKIEGGIRERDVGKNSLIMNNPDLMLRKSILTKNDAITHHK
jgi:hypothetical protein